MNPALSLGNGMSPPRRVRSLPQVHPDRPVSEQVYYFCFYEKSDAYRSGRRRSLLWFDEHESGREDEDHADEGRGGRHFAEDEVARRAHGDQLGVLPDAGLGGVADVADGREEHEDVQRSVDEPHERDPGCCFHRPVG